MTCFCCWMLLLNSNLSWLCLWMVFFIIPLFSICSFLYDKKGRESLKSLFWNFHSINGGDLIKGEGYIKCLIMFLSLKLFIFQNDLSLSKRGRMLVYILSFNEINSFWKMSHYVNSMMWYSKLLWWWWWNVSIMIMLKYEVFLLIFWAMLKWKCSWWRNLDTSAL